MSQVHKLVQKVIGGKKIIIIITSKLCCMRITMGDKFVDRDFSVTSLERLAIAPKAPARSQELESGDSISSAESSSSQPAHAAIRTASRQYIPRIRSTRSSFFQASVNFPQRFLAKLLDWLLSKFSKEPTAPLPPPRCNSFQRANVALLPPLLLYVSDEHGRGFCLPRATTVPFFTKATNLNGVHT